MHPLPPSYFLDPKLQNIEMLITCFRSHSLYNSFLVLVVAQILLIITYVRISYVYEDVTNSKSYDQLFFAQHKSNADKQSHNISSGSISMKKILFWTKDNENSQEYVIGGLGRDAFQKAGCPVWQCENHNQIMLNGGNNSGLLVQDYDAIVFFEPAWVFGYTPVNRSAHQHYIFWTLEAPGYLRNLEDWSRFEGLFNRTMTYRLDSDIVTPYGWFLPIDPSVVPMYPNQSQLKELLSRTKVTDFVRGKSKMAVWAVSNCKATNGRNELVDRLSKFIEVDIYGKCGNKSCPRSDDAACRRKFSETYKFYLALENSFCVDYVTEKFFNQMRNNIIPVVFDLHGNYAKFAPPHSYINAADFPSVLHMADYLKKLDRDDELYAQYFWWKKHYVIHDNVKTDYRHSMCQLCELLHGRNIDKPSQVYEDLIDWWDKKSECKDIRFSKLLNETSMSVEDNTWTVHSTNHAYDYVKHF